MKLVWTALLCACAACARENAVPAPTILAVTADRTTAPVYERITLSVDLIAGYDNPFDADQVRLEAVVAPPDGEAWTVPGFLYRPFERRLENGTEQLSPAGEPAWQVRLSLWQPGEHAVTVRLTDAGGTVSAPPVTLTAEPADAPGFVRRSADDHRYFVTDRGETFFLIGANVCWGNAPGSFSYDTWLPKYADAGCNWIRLWLAPEWFTCALQTRASGWEGIDLGNAWRLDYLVEQCERLGLRAMLCIDSFNILRFRANQYGSWEDSPYFAANGGPLAEPREYFTNPAMLDAYRDRLRYLVARWGYSPAVFAWEFWNEVDIIDQFEPEPVAAWHQTMARELRALDPWRHLIGTSHARTAGIPVIDALPELEFVQSHSYGARDMAAQLTAHRATKEAARDRPHFHGEFGISGDGRQTREVDPSGIHLRNGLFSSLGGEQAGTPMTWWWDSYVEPRNLYVVLAEFAAWQRGFDPVAQRARPVDARVIWPDDRPRPLEEVSFAPEAASWDPAPFNQPVTVRIAPDGTVEQTAPLSRVLHGVANHPTLHNPVTFEFDAPEATQLIVSVHGVSGHGGAALELRLDGEAKLNRDFADETDDTETMQQYNGDYAIEVPAGAHSVTVENRGRDWCYISYRLPRLVRRAGPPVRVYGLVGESAGRVWVQNPEYTWPRATAADFVPTRFDDLTMELRGMRPGRWTAVHWPPPPMFRPAVYPVGDDGVLRFGLPEIERDAAFTLEWMGE